MSSDSITFLNKLAQVISDKKGFNLLALDVRGLSSITDYLLIAEGNVDKHAVAIARAVLEEFEEKPAHIEGLQMGDWIVIDYCEVMIHLFTSDLRERYQLERLWPESSIVELDVDYSEGKKVVGEEQEYS